MEPPEGTGCQPRGKSGNFAPPEVPPGRRRFEPARFHHLQPRKLPLADHDHAPATAPGAFDADGFHALMGPLLGGLRIRRNRPLAPLTTFRIGGPADLFVETRTPDELARTVTAARDLGIPYFLLGEGANILVSDEGIRGLVIHSKADDIEFLPGGRVRAAAGVRVFPDLIVETVRRGLGGLHHFVGIPSSVGGALWQNLHFLSPAPERERTVFIEEVLESAEILTVEGERKTVGVEYFEFGYDDSILHRRPDVVLSATFRLESVPEVELRRVMTENLQWRDDRHPDLWLYPSAGSIFQKIEGIGAGRLIDQCGLKGHVHGAAGIFHRHANIVVNLGGATAAEVLYLIDLARDTVLRETGHELIPEIGLIGEF
jgi:UDP-N-acetylmuramate dehydrogenase